jgi:hypothetical protein
MTVVTIPRATVPFVGNAPMSPEWYRWARDITQRVGGPTGASSSDLELSQFEDAGIEEAKAQVISVLQELRQMPIVEIMQTVDALEGQVGGLLDQISQLRTEIEALKQGVSA